MDKHLLMWLEGPMQSWGSDSRFGRRETLDFPTKSAICGIICAALGAGGPQEKLLKKISAFPMTVFGYGLAETDPLSGKEESKLVRKPSRLRDFHMVGSGYGNSDWEKAMVPKTVEGKAAVGGGTKITYRYYLQDAAFAVILTMDEKSADEIGAALQNPVWFSGLGRKSCMPTEWIYQGVFDTLTEAREKADSIARSTEDGLRVRKLPRLEIREGAWPEEGTVESISDIPLSFGLQKAYAPRTVTLIELPPPSEES